MFDHIGFNVSDFVKSKAFFVAALAPLGITVAMGGEGWAMLGKNGKPQFWFGTFGPAANAIYLAFAA